MRTSRNGYRSKQPGRRVVSLDGLRWGGLEVGVLGVESDQFAAFAGIFHLEASVIELRDAAVVEDLRLFGIRRAGVVTVQEIRGDVVDFALVDLFRLELCDLGRGLLAVEGWGYSVPDKRPPERASTSHGHTLKAQKAPSVKGFSGSRGGGRLGRETPAET